MLKQLSVSLGKVLTTSFFAIAIAAISFAFFATQTGNAQNSAVDVNSLLPKKTIHDYAPQTGFADLIESVSPAVVHVSIIGTPKSSSPNQEFNFPPGSPFEEFFKRYRQPGQEQKQKKRPLGIGSGFLVSPDGYLITNNHVIDGGDEIKITLANGDEFDGKLIGKDKKTDLAVVKIESNNDFPFVEWGDDERSRIGDWVLAIGHPFGLNGGASASTGIISARGRDIRSGPYDDYLQVDAAINRGNSGGPLFNLNGEVIGINTAIYSPNGGSVGIGFAIPSTLARSVTKQLINSGTVERGLIGVQIQQITDELMQGFGRKNKHGALVTSVVPGKPAEKAKLQAGDIILSFDGKRIKEMRDLPRIVAETKVGKTVSIQVWRDGKKIKKKIKVVKFDDQELTKSPSSEKNDSGSDSEEGEIGAVLKTIDEEMRLQLDLKDSFNGVLIERVNRDGLAAANGLLAGDIIQKIGKKRIKKPNDVDAAIKLAKKNDVSTVVMLVYRDNGVSFVPFIIE